MAHRFIGKFPLEAKQFWIADRELSHQVREVLRLEPGEKIILSDGENLEASAEIVSFDKEAVEVKILEVSESSAEPETEVILYLAILKKENFELAAQKAVEAGVSRIVPLLTGHTVKLSIRRDRLEKIIKEAAEQAGRSILPTLGEETEFKNAVAEAGRNWLNILFNPGEKRIDLPKNAKGKRIGIFIGPEGGWNELEVQSAKAAKFKLAGLGKFTLRAETAAMISVYEVVSALEKQ